MAKKEKQREREIPEIHIGDYKIEPRPVPLTINEEAWKKLEKIIEENRKLEEKEREE